jgi:hypothetical protein
MIRGTYKRRSTPYLRVPTSVQAFASPFSAWAGIANDQLAPRIVQHVAVISAFAIIATVIVFARPQKAAAPITSRPDAQVEVVQK